MTEKDSENIKQNYRLMLNATPNDTKPQMWLNSTNDYLACIIFNPHYAIKVILLHVNPIPLGVVGGWKTQLWKNHIWKVLDYFSQ